MAIQLIVHGAADRPFESAASGAAAGPSVTVVIPARNAAARIASCLAALAPEVQGARSVIVVADDGSTDATAETARRSGARVLQLEPRGPAAARNAGAKCAATELLVFVDADCIAGPGCLAALVEPFADPAVVGVRGGYTSTQTALIARFVQLEMEEKQTRLAASRRVSLMDTACAAYRRIPFLAAGGFDERFPATSAEDVDLAFRLAARGARFVYAPAARVEHRHVETLPLYLRRKLRFGCYRTRLYRRYPREIADDGYTPPTMPLQIGLTGILALAAVASPRFASARRIALMATLAFIATTAPLTRRALRRDAQLALMTPPLLLLRSLAQGCGAVIALFGLTRRQ